MDNDFWLQRWQDQQTPWHLQHPHVLLETALDKLGDPGGTALVPLCGKSQDMVVLAARGYAVLGVELAEPAVAAFYREQGMRPEIQQQGALRRWQAGPWTIFQGDFFLLPANACQDVGLIWDRAALSALDAPLRCRYARHLDALVPAEAVMALVTFEHRAGDEGPPFSVAPEEVATLFGQRFAIEVFAHREASDELPHLTQRMGRIFERGYLLRPLGSGHHHAAQDSAAAVTPDGRGGA
jgi:thiopurine S-methyltransferase